MVHATKDLMQRHLVAMRRTQRIRPGSIVKTIRVHDKGIAIPTADRISVIRRLGVIDGLSAIGPNVAPGMTPLEKFYHFVGSLKESHQRCKNLKHDAWVTRRLTLQHWVIPLFFWGDWGRDARRPAVCE